MHSTNTANAANDVPASAPLLEVRDLVTVFHTDEGDVRAVDGVSFVVPDGVTVGIVGESGCGKSVTSLSVMRLNPKPGEIINGSLCFQGRELLKLSEREMRSLRGNDIAMIFQEPMSSLNPVYTVGAQIIEAFRQHQKLSRKEARAQTIELLRQVGIPAPDQRIDAYPHELSGGMRQRIMIAMALCCRPRLLIADEPTTALDVTIQAQILELLRDLQTKMGMSVMLITHDLGVVAEYADEVVVMYAGKVVERAPVHALFTNPRHPYTQGLLASLPTTTSSTKSSAKRLPTIAGSVPDLRHLPPGCRFQDRCDQVMAVCREKEPAFVAYGDHTVACFAAATQKGDA